MSDRRGFGLLAALWIVTVIGLVGLQSGAQLRHRREAILNAADAVRGRAAAEAGLAHTRARLELALRAAEGLDSERVLSLDPWAHPDALMADSSGEVGEAFWRVRLIDAGAFLDLNRASEQEVRRLLIALRVDGSDADEIAQSIADWRDADDLRRARGAEREWYERARRFVHPRNGPFVDLRELRHVRGVTEELYGRMTPYLSVAGAQRVNMMTAPRPVLLTLPGMGEEATAAVLRLRLRGQPFITLDQIANELSGSAKDDLVARIPGLVRRVTADTREVLVVSEGFVEGGPILVTLQALASRGPGSGSPLVMRTLR